MAPGMPRPECPARNAPIDQFELVPLQADRAVRLLRNAWGADDLRSLTLAWGADEVQFRDGVVAVATAISQVPAAPLTNLRIGDRPDTRSWLGYIRRVTYRPDQVVL